MVDEDAKIKNLNLRHLQSHQPPCTGGTLAYNVGG